MLDFERVIRRHGKIKIARRGQVKEHIGQIGLKKEEAIGRTKWINGVYLPCMG